MSYVAQVSIPYFTGIPTDVVTNTFHWAWSGPSAPTTTDFQNVGSALQIFYQTVFAPANTPSMSAWMRPANTTFKLYDLSQPIPRVPVLAQPQPLTVKQDTTTNIAPEAAVCLSLKAASIPGVNPASTRGRIFLGGLGTGCFTNGTTSSFVTVNSLMQSQCKTAATNLALFSGGTYWDWFILSRAVGIGWPVIGGFIDNAVDTQRRRANAATGRVLWP